MFKKDLLLSDNQNSPALVAVDIRVPGEHLWKSAVLVIFSVFKFVI